jgi:alanine racemase
MEFAPQAFIDHAALRHNLKRAQHTAKRSRIWAVIKADGYGHGMLRVAEALKQADGFAVARLDEALELRNKGIEKPLLVLSGCISATDFAQAADAELQLVIHHRHQLKNLPENLTGSAPLAVWLKVDTGMHRLGFEPDDIGEIHAELQAHPTIGRVNLMTHLANADNPGDPATQHQCDLFLSLASSAFGALSIANSAALLAHPESHTEWVRPGIMLYGASPFIHSAAAQHGLLPVMTLQSRVIAVKACRAGDRVGYGGQYICPEAMPVAVIAIGYGDGYPRHAPSGTPVLVNGVRLPLAGRVSMDMITLDARQLPAVQVGDVATLWGKGLPVDEIAQQAGTIAYELLCGVKQRVRFIDINREKQ